MTNVLLSKDYKARKAGTLLKGLSDLEATAIENLGLGTKVKEEEAPKKGAKAAASE